jgi:steroid Delta-isomerase
MVIHPSNPSLLHTTSAEAAQVDRVVHFFQSLQSDSIAHLGDYYVQDAYFKDPFNEVHDLSGILRIFNHMFVALDSPHFIVTERVVQGGQCFLVWDFKFRLKRFDTITDQVVRGTSHLRFAADGRICYHRDYWDAAEELYEKLPLLRGLMRWLKRRANT